MKSVKLSQNLESIGTSAFQDCSSLSDIHLPYSLQSIGFNTFESCSALKEIYIPSSTTLGEFIFYNAGLESITLGEGIETIPYYAFAGTNIQEIALPSTVKMIEDYAFANCEKLVCLVLNEGLTRIGNAIVSRSSNLTEIIIPSTVTNMSEYSFIYCDNLHSIKFEGNAPSVYLYNDIVFDGLWETKIPAFTIYYHENTTGFTSSEWNGYPTQLW